MITFCTGFAFPCCLHCFWGEGCSTAALQKRGIYELRAWWLSLQAHFSRSCLKPATGTWVYLCKGNTDAKYVSRLKSPFCHRCFLSITHINIYLRKQACSVVSAAYSSQFNCQCLEVCIKAASGQKKKPHTRTHAAGRRLPFATTQLYNLVLEGAHLPANAIWHMTVSEMNAIAPLCE